MIYGVLFGVFAVGGFALLSAGVTGRRGKVCVRNVGYTVPAEVEADPELNKKANALVGFWCTLAAFLTLPALFVIAGMGTRLEGPIPLWALAGLAAYGFVLVVIGTYPFEKIKRMAGEVAQARQ